MNQHLRIFTAAFCLLPLLTQASSPAKIEHESKKDLAEMSSQELVKLVEQTKTPSTYSSCAKLYALFRSAELCHYPTAFKKGFLTTIDKLLALPNIVPFAKGHLIELRALTSSPATTEPEIENPAAALAKLSGLKDLLNKEKIYGNPIHKCVLLLKIAVIEYQMMGLQQQAPKSSREQAKELSLKAQADAKPQDPKTVLAQLLAQEEVLLQHPSGRNTEETNARQGLLMRTCKRIRQLKPLVIPKTLAFEAELANLRTQRSIAQEITEKLMQEEKIDTEKLDGACALIDELNTKEKDLLDLLKKAKIDEALPVVARPVIAHLQLTRSEPARGKEQIGLPSNGLEPVGMTGHLLMNAAPIKRPRPQKPSSFEHGAVLPTAARVVNAEDVYANALAGATADDNDAQFAAALAASQKEYEANEAERKLRNQNPASAAATATRAAAITSDTDIKTAAASTAAQSKTFPGDSSHDADFQRALAESLGIPASGTQSSAHNSSAAMAKPAPTMPVKKTATDAAHLNPNHFGSESEMNRVLEESEITAAIEASMRTVNAPPASPVEPATTQPAPEKSN